MGRFTIPNLLLRVTLSRRSTIMKNKKRSTKKQKKEETVTPDPLIKALNKVLSNVQKDEDLKH